MPMARNTANVIAIELLAAAQACDFHLPLKSSEPLESVRALLRARVPTLEADRHFAPDIAAAGDIVCSGGLVDAAGAMYLPALQV